MITNAFFRFLLYRIYEEEIENIKYEIENVKCENENVNSKKWKWNTLLCGVAETGNQIKSEKMRFSLDLFNTLFFSWGNSENVYRPKLAKMQFEAGKFDSQEIEVVLKQFNTVFQIMTPIKHTFQMRMYFIFLDISVWLNIYWYWFQLFSYFVRHFSYLFPLPIYKAADSSFGLTASSFIF